MTATVKSPTVDVDFDFPFCGKEPGDLDWEKEPHELQ